MWYIVKPKQSIILHSLKVIPGKVVTPSTLDSWSSPAHMFANETGQTNNTDNLKFVSPPCCNVMLEELQDMAPSLWSSVLNEPIVGTALGQSSSPWEVHNDKQLVGSLTFALSTRQYKNWTIHIYLFIYFVLIIRI